MTKARSILASLILFGCTFSVFAQEVSLLCERVDNPGYGVRRWFMVIDPTTGTIKVASGPKPSSTNRGPGIFSTGSGTATALEFCGNVPVSGLGHDSRKVCVNRSTLQFRIWYTNADGESSVPNGQCEKVTTQF